MHFIGNVFEVASFSLVNAVILVILAFIYGYVLGWAFAWAYNKLK